MLVSTVKYNNCSITIEYIALKVNITSWKKFHYDRLHNNSRTPREEVTFSR
jgi:hypothetical protein